jgi:hypothetical protein
MSQLIDEHVVRERECIHKSKGVAGSFFPAELYLKALQNLGSEQALRLSRKVGAFFWSDAAHVKVWLCTECAREAGLER